MRYFLIGMPGSGKSTVGKHLASELDQDFIDLDNIIVQKAGKPITDIFEQDGEEVFRELEMESLKFAISEYDNLVCATGGGAPCFHDNLNTMKRAGTVIYLNTGLDQIMERLRNEVNIRPLLSGDPVAKLQGLIDLRGKIYEQADSTVDASRPVSEVVQSILEIKSKGQQ